MYSLCFIVKQPKTSDFNMGHFNHIIIGITMTSKSIATVCNVLANTMLQIFASKMGIKSTVTGSQLLSSKQI